MDIRPHRPAFLAALLVTLFTASPVPAQTIRSSFWHPDAAVRAIAVGDNVIYMGGAFQHMCAPTGSASMVDPTNGMPTIPYFNVEGGSINAILPDGSGGWYIGGSFTSVEGRPWHSLAHIDAAGNVAPWHPVGDAIVTSLALSGSVIYIGALGTIFSSDPPRSYFAAAYTDFSMMTPFTPAFDGPVNTLRVAGGKLYVGGQFHNADVQTRNLAAAYDLPTAPPFPPVETLNAWDPNLSGNPAAAVNAMEVQGNRVYLGGTFDMTGSTFTHRLSAVDGTDGQTVFTVPSVTGADVKTIVATRQTTAPFAPTIWIGGDYTMVNMSIRQDIAAFDTTNTVLPFNPTPNNVVRALRVATDASGNPTAIYAGGDFTMIGGAAASYLASISPAGVGTAWPAQPNNPVFALAPAPNAIVAGGTFTTIQVVRSHLVAVDATSGIVTPFNPSIFGTIRSLALHGNSLYMAGTIVPPVGPGQNVAELNLATGTLTSWNPVIDGVTSVNVVARPRGGNTVYIGGRFDGVGGQSCPNVAAIDATTGLPLPFNASPDNTVLSLLVQESTAPPYDAQTLWIGGSFAVVNQGMPWADIRQGIAAVDPVTGRITPWFWNNVPAANPVVNSIVRAEGAPFSQPKILVGGACTVNFTQCVLLSQIDEATGANENGSLPQGSPALAMAYSPGRLYVGGQFTKFVGSQSVPYLGMIPVPGFDISGWVPAPNDDVLALGKNGTTLYVGGAFTTISGSTTHPYFAAISDGTVTGVAIEPTTEAPAVLAAHPNPFYRQTTVRFTLPCAEPVHAVVYDVAGRHVRDLQNGILSAGEHQLAWSGLDDSGQGAAKGIYFLRVEAASLHRSAKVLLLR